MKDGWHTYMNKRSIERVRKTKPDILMTLNGETIRPETLWELRRKTDAHLLVKANLMFQDTGMLHKKKMRI